MPQLLTTLLYLMHILASISEQLFAGFNFIAIGISYHVLKRTQKLHYEAKKFLGRGTAASPGPSPLGRGHPLRNLNPIRRLQLLETRAFGALRLASPTSKTLHRL